MSATATKATFASPTAQDVREWAKSQGITDGYGSRGRLSPTLIAAFNKGKRGKARYAEKVEPVVTVTVKPAKGRAITRQVVLSAARAAALDAGVPVGERGRLSREVLEAYVLGTLSAPTED